LGALTLCSAFDGQPDIQTLVIPHPHDALLAHANHFVGCLVAYSGLLIPPGTKAAFVFLISPLLSWILILTGIPIAASISRRKINRSNFAGNNDRS